MGFKAALIAALLCFSAPAFAQVAIIAGTDTGSGLGHAFASGSLTVVATTTATVPSGNLIVAMPAASGTLTWTGCSDSASNTYTAAFANTITGTNTIRMFYSRIANTLTSGGTITCTANSGSGAKTLVTVAFSNIISSPLDASSAATTQAVAATTYTIGPTGTLTYPGGTNAEVVIGYVKPNATAAPTNDASFTDLGTFSGGGGTQADAVFGYKIVSASTAITYAPTGTSAAYVGNLGAFIGTGGSGPTLQGGTLLRGAGR